MSQPIQLCTDHVLARLDDGVGWITLNNPDRHNAISSAMFAALDEAVVALDEFAELRAVVITGAGNQAFCSGADINDLSADSSTLPAGLGRLQALPVPTVAMIRGYCIGGGLMTALTTDIRIASDDAVFAIPAGRLGVGYPLTATMRLVDLAGPTAASRILLTADRFSASEAKRMGLISDVVAGSDLETSVSELVSRLIANAPLSARASKLSIAAALGRADHEDAQAAIKQCWSSEDYAEGSQAFAERRLPHFGGR